MDSLEYSRKILELCRRKNSPEEMVLVNEAIAAYVAKNYEKIDEVLVKLDNDFKLLEQLVLKLKGKSVYTGLKNLMEGKDQSNEQAIISTASLISHVAIEMKEHKHYRRLLPDLYKKLGELIRVGK